ncbi:MAG: hypothetical protein LQ346_004252 [Caloplaca aetnensis]|nr:MAG: hypothetical protein LQ346_004252 [Caloplaca aetnensis]
MTASFVCQRCRQQLVQRRKCVRGIGFVSLSQIFRHPNHNPAPERKGSEPRASSINDQCGDVDDAGTKTRVAQRQRLPLKARRSTPRDPALETLFSSQQEKQRDSTQSSSSESHIKQILQYTKPGAKKPSTRAHHEQPLDPSNVKDDSENTVARLWQRGEQLEKSINIIGSLLGHSSHATSSQYHHAAGRVTKIIKDVEGAVQRFDVRQVGVQWQKYQRTLAQVDLNQQLREAIYTQFLTAYFTLSRGEKAVDVWNHMVEAGITPNQRHWNAMLKGCFKGQDATSLQQVWKNMIASGTAPDIACWTSYIHGLIMCGKWERGLQALDDLGATWKAASKKRRLQAQTTPQTAQPQSSPPVDFDPSKPSLAPVQAAITALTALQRHELCLPLLKWAKSYNITPTTEIFNVLLRPAVRRGDTAHTARIFALMKANNCPANEATYMILLNGHMLNTNSSYTQSSPQEQRDSIIRILDDMTANNISIDLRIYSTIMQGIMTPPDKRDVNENAAQAVLQHMAQNNVNPDSYIYHMLVTYHFARDPPDVRAVEDLWTRIKIERPSLQSIVYEKMVEGFAKVGEVEKMMFFLRRFAKEGKSPRWMCLKDVLDTLIEENDWELVKELVKDVRDTRNGLMRYADENTGGTTRQAFWERVNDVKGRIEEVGQSAEAL